MRPFAALPHDIAGDPRLSPTDVRVLLALLFWARAKPECWPSDPSIAARIGRCVGTVQRSLRHLEELDLVERRKTDANRTGRVLVLRWRVTGQAPPADPRRSPARDEGSVIVKGEARTTPAGEGTQILERSRSEAEPTSTPPPEAPATPEFDPVGIPIPEPERPPAPKSPPAPAPFVDPPDPAPLRDPPVPDTPAIPLTPEQAGRLAELPPAAREQVLGWLATGIPCLVKEALAKLAPPMASRPEAPTSLIEVLRRIREDPSYPGLAAQGLARALGDEKSYSGYLARCTEAWRGEIPVERLVDAYEQAGGPKAKRPGAVFMHVVQRAPGG